MIMSIAQQVLPAVRMRLLRFNLLILEKLIIKKVMNAIGDNGNGL